MANDRGPLARWARRKAEAKRSRGGAAPVIEEESRWVPATGEAADAKPGEDAGSEEVESPEAAVEQLPDIDSLTAESDFTAFLKEGVPAELKRLALRKLWLSDPVFANLDGLVDYGEDYTRITSGVFAAAQSVAKSGDPAGGRQRDGGGKLHAPEEAEIVDNPPDEEHAREQGAAAVEDGEQDADEPDGEAETARNPVEDDPKG